MNMNEMRIPSSNGKDSLYVRVYRPQGKPRAALQIVHGYAEHIARYHEVMRYFQEQGFLVYGDDHLGHGRTARPADLGDFGSYSAFDEILDDEIRVAKTVLQDEAETLPRYILGHSMGSLMTRALLIREPKFYDRAVIMGTGTMNGFEIAGSGLVLGWYRFFKRGNQRIPFLSKVGIEGYDKPFQPNKMKNEWLSENVENVKRYNNDPLSGNPGSLHTFWTLNELMKCITKKKNLSKMNKDLPVLFLSGEDDAFGNFTKGPEAVIRSFEKAGMRDVQKKYYPHARHEILNEACRDEVLEDMLAFFDKAPA